MANRPGTFQKGNKAAVGNPGPTKARPITSAIIQKLNEINKKTDRAYIFDVVDEIFEQALPTFIEEHVSQGRGKNKKTVLVKKRVPGDLHAIKEITDRAEGKTRQVIAADDGPEGEEFEVRLVRRVIVDPVKAKKP